MKRLMRVLSLILVYIPLIAGGQDDRFVYDILTAAWIGRPSDVEECLSNGEDIETLSPKNETPLILAAKGEYKEFATGGGHKETVKLLLSKEANVNAKDDQGNTALLWAVTKDDPDIVQALIDAKSDLKVVNQQNQTVLFLAKEYGSKEVCRVLLRHLDNKEKEELLFKAVGDQDDEFVYDILTAAWIGRPSNVEKCLSNGENIEKLSAKNETPLILAAKGEHKEFATEGGHKETVKLLLSKEANVNAKDDQGYTALLWAVTRDDPDIVQALIDAHSDLNVVNQQNQTALFLATEDGSKEVFKVLLRSLDNKEKEELLFKAVEESDIKLLEYLVFAGVNLEAKDQEGATALMRACIKGKLSAIEILVDDGSADLEAENNAYQTALSLAVFHNKIESVEFLLKRGAKRDPIDQYGTTPLIIAAYRGYADILRKLLQYEADPRFRTQKKIGLECEGLGEIRIPAGATALDFARKFNQGKDIIEELIRAERSFMPN